MLPETEVKERARYCYCVFRQLNWLYGNTAIPSSEYLTYLKKSSLGLGEDDFIMLTLEEAVIQENPEQGLQSLLNLYEGFLHALCEVLETDMEAVKNEISPELLQRLAAEMNVDIS
jgi:hypothetical protein